MTLMARLGRLIANIVLWVMVVLGVLGAATWGANQLGWLQPLVVVSGSMQPTIATGDLILARPVPATDLAVGQVTTLPSSLGGTLITHRITEITATGDTLQIRMQGDANAVVDPESYVLGAQESAWTPWIVLPDAGRAVAVLTDPQVLLPLGIGLLALLAVVLWPVPARPRPGDGDPTAGPAGAEHATSGASP